MSGKASKSPRKGGKKKRALERMISSSAEGSSPAQAFAPHKHCFNCGIAISPDKDICTDKCQQEWDSMLKRKKLMTYLPLIGGLLLILFYILVISS
ncbi:MAG: DUF2116 family Zn-ribbon domain-containing protein [Thermoplasmatota archaeon]